MPPETAPAVTNAAPQLDEAAFRAKVTAEVLERSKKIEALISEYKIEDKHKDTLRSFDSIEKAEIAVAKIVLEREKQIEAPKNSHVTLIRDEADSFRAAAIDALFMRKNGEYDDKGVKRQAAPGAHTLMGKSNLRLAQEALERKHISTSGMSDSEIVERAFSSSDLPFIFGAVANKAVMQGFENADTTYQDWVDTSGSLPNFQLRTLLEIGEFGDLERIPENGPYPVDSLTEGKETVKLERFGKIF